MTSASFYFGLTSLQTLMLTLVMIIKYMIMVPVPYPTAR